MDLIDSPRRGAGDSINSSKISKAITATSSSPAARHCLDTFKMLGMNSRNLTCIIMKKIYASKEKEKIMLIRHAMKAIQTTAEEIEKDKTYNACLVHLT